MSLKPILVIKDTLSTIGIRARVGDEFAEHEIQLSLMLAYYWDNNLPVIENLVDLFETVVKRTVNEVVPHKNLYLKYNLITDAEISSATRFEIHLIEVKADDTDLRLDGKILALKGLKSQEDYSNNSDSDEFEFKVGDKIDVTAISKGKGFQGAIKRHGQSRGPMAHGSKYHRHAGSNGACSSPSRVFKGKRMPGHMGCVTITVKNLEVVRIDADKNLLLVKGAVPGAKKALVTIKETTKAEA